MKQVIYFSAINLGCSKNLVDTQYLIGNLLSKNNSEINIKYSVDPYDDNVEIVFLNTCGFIKSARDEMIEKIESLLEYNKKIVLLGCGLKYLVDLDNVDKNVFLANPNVCPLSWKDVDKLNLLCLDRGESIKRVGNYIIPEGIRIYSNAQQKFEYLKIADGCNTNCSFCIIPKIRGKQVSLSIEQILDEVNNMIGVGIEEIILISQDTSRYGMDIYGKPNLLELLSELDQIDKDFSYRLLYLYPDLITIKHLEKMKNLKKFIPYFDIPLQHVSDTLLKKMRRSYDKKSIMELLKYINNNFEEKYIRTNFIVGFPGETDQDFQDLYDFVDQKYFDNIAIFEYHDEKFADSFKLDGKVNEEIIRDRFNKLKQLVDGNLDLRRLKNKAKQFVGYIMDYVTEGGETKLVIRPYLHAPEIDPFDVVEVEKIVGVFQEKNELEIGDKVVYEL